MADDRKRDKTIPIASVNPMVDTVYRVGGESPYEAGNYYTQSQLNNNMSGNDANSIYYATHDQTKNNSWNYYNNENHENEALVALANEALIDALGEPIGPFNAPDGNSFFDIYPRPDRVPPDERNMPKHEWSDGIYRERLYSDPEFMEQLLFTNETPGGQALAKAHRYLGYKPDTGQQLVDDSSAYVTGADALEYPGSRNILPLGYGSFEGIPNALLQPETKRSLYSQLLEHFLEQHNKTPAVR